MKKFEDMSDGQLSFEVAKKTGDFGSVSFDNECCFVKHNLGWPRVFSINNWADMGPVFDEVIDGGTRAYCKWEQVREEYKCSTLRAAAICYLEAV